MLTLVSFFTGIPGIGLVRKDPHARVSDLGGYANTLTALCNQKDKKGEFVFFNVITVGKN